MLSRKHWPRYPGLLACSTFWKLKEIVHRYLTYFPFLLFVFLFLLTGGEDKLKLNAVELIVSLLKWSQKWLKSHRNFSPYDSCSSCSSCMKWQCGQYARWVLTIMAYTGGLRPKGVTFSGFRYIKGYGFHKIKLGYIKGWANGSFRYSKGRWTE